MKRAILLEPPKFPIDQLYTEYDVEFIIPQRLDAIRWREDLNGFYEFMMEWAVKNFNIDKDYFVVTGNQSMLVVASLAIQQIWHLPVKLICYDNLDKRYYEVLNGQPTQQSA